MEEEKREGGRAEEVEEQEKEEEVGKEGEKNVVDWFDLLFAERFIFTDST